MANQKYIHHWAEKSVWILNRFSNHEGDNMRPENFSCEISVTSYFWKISILMNLPQRTEDEKYAPESIDWHKIVFVRRFWNWMRQQKQSKYKIIMSCVQLEEMTYKTVFLLVQQRQKQQTSWMSNLQDCFCKHFHTFYKYLNLQVHQRIKTTT